MSLRWGWLGGLVVISCLVGAGVARADDAAAAGDLFKKGQAHYAVGEYEAAAEAYQNAYKLKPDPALLFNAAQSLRLGGKLDRALILYRNYLRFYPQASNVETVQGHISKLEQQIESERAAATTPPAVDPARVSPVPSAAPPISEPPAVADTAPPPAPPERPLYKKPWFWGVVGAVAVAAAVGVAIAVASSGESGTWNNLPDVRELRGAAVARW
jgi:tetratricopeptide (TPR) repeat protein